jgi:hypothetical protein
MLAKEILARHLAQRKAVIITIRCPENHKRVVTFSKLENDAVTEEGELPFNCRGDVVVYSHQHTTVFEICWTSPTLEENRQEPWYEFHAEEILDQWDRQDGVQELKLTCIRKRKCPGCSQVEERCLELGIELGYFEYEEGLFLDEDPTFELLHKAMRLATQNEPIFRFLPTIPKKVDWNHPAWAQVLKNQRCLMCTGHFIQIKKVKPFCFECFKKISECEHDFTHNKITIEASLRNSLRGRLSWLQFYPKASGGPHDVYCAACKDEIMQNYFPWWFGPRLVCFPCVKKDAERRGVLNEVMTLVKNIK